MGKETSDPHQYLISRYRSDILCTIETHETSHAFVL